MLNVRLFVALLTALAVTHSERTLASSLYSPYVSDQIIPSLFWGDTHLHTSLSPDAYSMGATLTPEDSYRFARGETVSSNSGQPVNIGDPLDFIVLADHAEFLGVFPLIDTGDPLFVTTKLGKRWFAMYQQGEQEAVFWEFIDNLWGRATLDYPQSVKQTIWKQVTAAAESANMPGSFTAFIGFEWSSLPDGNNLHRNVIFRDGTARADRVIPLSSVGNPDPEALWSYLEAYESTTGGQVLAIPHNGNGSNGAMFSDSTYSGDPLDAKYAKTRARWEPIYEVTQVKGDGETHPYLSPNDEFADYETWDYGNLKANPNPKEPWMLKHEYARSALKLGLGLHRSLGTNPFKIGLIGSTDSHTGLAAVAENNFWGKFASEEPGEGRLTAMFKHLKVRDYAASGYAAVWARENTRESLFDAMRSRETYATTGPRITVRFFGGWNFDPMDHLIPDFVNVAYQKGVPMGGELMGPPIGGKPQFLVFASKDPNGANLDRIQIVKGSLNSDGTVSEQVYNVSLSDDRSVDPRTGEVAGLPSTVDVSNATYTNSLGESQLSAIWTDEEFDQAQHAFYYVRVLEIATPRWTTYDAAYFGKTLPDDVPTIQHERAYTSPIWYTPIE